MSEHYARDLHLFYILANFLFEGELHVDDYSV